MDSAVEMRDWLVEVRRDLHRRPEPAWREFYTTARIVEELREIPNVDTSIGPNAIEPDERLGVPDEELTPWREQAREAGADLAVLDQLAGGQTGVVATLDRGAGPTVALRVDIDGLRREESTDQSHHPATEGFRSLHQGVMHACGHDAHAAIGLGVLRAIAESEDFQGTLKVLFQPAEEVVGGGQAMAESGHLDDVDYLLAVHIGLDHPTGTVVAGLEGFLAVTQFEATIEGESAHAGGHPEEGRNAIQAMATATSNLYGIPRHTDGATRVNVGRVEAGTASNVIAERATLEGEVRGGTTALMEYVRDEARDVLQSAATMHDCEVAIERRGEAPSATSDEALAAVVSDVAAQNERVASIVDRDELGGSEDATYLMRAVQESGGLATYVCVGTDHPGGHHTATFDVDEDSLVIGVEVLAETVQSLASEPL